MTYSVLDGKLARAVNLFLKPEVGGKYRLVLGVTLIPSFRPKLYNKCGVDSHSNRSVTQIHSPE